MSYGSNEYAQAPYAGESSTAHVNPTANSLHASAHAVMAAPLVRAHTLHATAHPVAYAGLRNRARTLHATAHIVTVAGLRNRAKTLHAAGHLVSTVGLRYHANTLHITGHFGTARPPLHANTLHVRGTPVHAEIPTQQYRYTLELVTRARPDLVLSVLAGTHDRHFQDQLSDVGSGQIIVDNDDADATALSMERLVRFKVGVVPAWAMLIESRNPTVVVEGEEHDETTTIAGRGHSAIMEEAVVYPTFGVGHRPVEEDRLFDWAAAPTVYDDVGWIAPHVLGTYTAGDTTLGFPQNNWPDLTAQVITTNLYNPAGTPSGYIYFRKHFTLAAPIYMTVLVHGDDRTRVFVDGVLLMTSENNGLEGEPSAFQAPRQSIHLDAGDHVIAVELVNYWDEPGFPLEWGPSDGASLTYAFNLTSLILTAMVQNGDGTLGDVVVHTDNTWLMKEYPSSPPGMTPGQVLRILLAEAHARGSLLEVSLGFGDVYDSNGNAWGFIDYTTKVGTDYLTVLKEMAQSYIDWWFDPTSFVLNACTKGGRGGASGVALHTPTDVNDSATGNLRELAIMETV